MSHHLARAKGSAPSAVVRLSSKVLALGFTASLAGCGPSAPRDRSDPPPIVRPPVEAELDSTGVASVEVNASVSKSSVKPHAFGMHASVYDNALHDPDLAALLNDAGIALLRWPGGGYSDNYHWSTHTMTPWQNGDNGYLAQRSDFGSFVGLLDATGTAAMITVNYGSNLQGTGPGEPKEAAAWVAYANGDPEDTTLIGEDSVGNDWRTVGYWASLRASAPLDEDDGQNFLRIERVEPLGIAYWEVGNEVFGNGYYSGEFELDLHVPYDGTLRRGHPDLSGSAYGRGVREYAAEMKAVDPTIRVGAVLNTPPGDNEWGPTWNPDVLAECARDIDFAIVHWYVPGNEADVLRAPRRTVPIMVEQLRSQIATHAGDHAANVELAMTELGPNFTNTGINQIAGYGSYNPSQRQVAGLFAAQAYVSLMQHDFFNIDWLELHNGSFLDERGQRKGAPYHGIQLAHRFVGPGDTFVETTSSHPASIVAHAARRTDGTIGILLFNVSPTIQGLASVTVAATVIPDTGWRYDFAPTRDAEGSLTAAGTLVGPSPLDNADNSFEVVLPPYSASLVLLDAPTP